MRILLISILITQIPQVVSVEEKVSDHALLLAKISTICSDRWEISTGQNGYFSIRSAKAVQGWAVGSNYPPGAELYFMHFRFQFVNDVNPKVVAESREQLKRLRKKAEGIRKVATGRTAESVLYFAKTPAERQLVLEIRQIEGMLKMVPKYKFESLFIREEYPIVIFKPNEGDRMARECMRDVRALYQLLTPIQSP